MICYRRLLNISYKFNVTNEEPSSHWIIWQTPDPGQETETKMVWPCFKVFWFSKDNLTGDSER